MTTSNQLDKVLTPTPESSPERGSNGGISLQQRSLPYRLKAFPPSYSPDSSPDRGSGGVKLLAAVGLPSKPIGVHTNNALRSSSERGIQKSVGDDGPPVFATQCDLDTAESSITRVSPAQNTLSDESRDEPSPERSFKRSAVSGDGVGDDAFLVSASQYDLDAAKSRTARLPPAKLSPHFFPDTSRSVSGAQRSPERSAISGDGADPSLRPSLQEFQEIQPPVAVPQHPSSNPPAYQARHLARRQRHGNRFQGIIPSRSRRRSFYRQLKVRLDDRLPVPIIYLLQECVTNEYTLCRNSNADSRTCIASCSRYGGLARLLGCDGNHLEVGPFVASERTTVPHDARSTHRDVVWTPGAQLPTTSVHIGGYDHWDHDTVDTARCHHSNAILDQKLDGLQRRFLCAKESNGIDVCEIA